MGGAEGGRGREAEKSHPDEKTGCVPLRPDLISRKEQKGEKKYSGKGSSMFQGPGTVLHALYVLFHVIFIHFIIPFFSLVLSLTRDLAN